MSTLSKISVVEREQYCQNIYEKYVFRTSEFLESCDGIANILRTYIPSGCYTNFRDILFHFRCMVNTNEEGALLSQVASIMEHANRATRDAEVALCVRCITVFEILKARYDLSVETIEILEHQINLLQDWTLKLRLGSMMLEGMEILSPSNEEFLDMMEKIFLMVEAHVAEEFKEVIAYSLELKEKFIAALKNIFDFEENNALRNFKAFATYNDVAELVYEAVFEA